MFHPVYSILQKRPMGCRQKICFPLQEVMKTVQKNFPCDFLFNTLFDFLKCNSTSTPLELHVKELGSAGLSYGPFSYSFQSALTNSLLYANGRTRKQKLRKWIGRQAIMISLFLSLSLPPPNASLTFRTFQRRNEFYVHPFT